MFSCIWVCLVRFVVSTALYEPYDECDNDIYDSQWGVLQSQPDQVKHEIQQTVAIPAVTATATATTAGTRPYICCRQQ